MTRRGGGRGHRSRRLPTLLAAPCLLALSLRLPVDVEIERSPLFSPFSATDLSARRRADLLPRRRPHVRVEPLATRCTAQSMLPRGSHPPSVRVTAVRSYNRERFRLALHELIASPIRSRRDGAHVPGTHRRDGPVLVSRGGSILVSVQARRRGVHWGVRVHVSATSRSGGHNGGQRCASFYPCTHGASDENNA